MRHWNNYLEHVGVKGMRWGVRKDKEVSSLRKAIRKKKISELTDDELNQRINRLERERRYMDLLNPQARPAQQVQRGQGIIRRTLARSGNTVATTVATGAMTILVGRALDRHFGTGAGQAITGRNPNAFPSRAARATPTVGRTVQPAASNFNTRTLDGPGFG